MENTVLEYNFVDVVKMAGHACPNAMAALNIRLGELLDEINNIMVLADSISIFCRENHRVEDTFLH